MTAKKILIARPNVLIVEEMTRAIRDCGLEPVRISHIDEINNIKTAEIAGAVVSTAVNSAVAASFESVITALRTQHPGIPLLLATLIRADKATRLIDQQLKRQHLQYQLHILSECPEGASFDATREMVILQKEDLTDDRKRVSTLQVMRSLFGVSEKKTRASA